MAGRLGELVQDEGRQDVQVGGAGVAWEGRVARCSGEDRGCQREQTNLYMLCSPFTLIDRPGVAQADLQTPL